MFLGQTRLGRSWVATVRCACIGMASSVPCVTWHICMPLSRCTITLHYITLSAFSNATYTLKWPVVHQQLHVIRNTAHRPSTQASYTASWVRPKRKISCAAAQIAATLTISFPRWRHMSLTSYWGQQRMSLTSYPGHFSSPHISVYAFQSQTSIGATKTISCNHRKDERFDWLNPATLARWQILKTNQSTESRTKRRLNWACVDKGRANQPRVEQRGGWIGHAWIRTNQSTESRTKRRLNWACVDKDEPINRE